MNQIRTNEIITRDADAATILDQIGMMALWSVGARDVIVHRDGIQCTVGRGSRRQLTVKRNASDLYAVEIIRLRRDLDVVSDWFADDVHCEDLTETILRAADEAGI